MVSLAFCLLCAMLGRLGYEDTVAAFSMKYPKHRFHALSFLPETFHTFLAFGRKAGNNALFARQRSVRWKVIQRLFLPLS